MNANVNKAVMIIVTVIVLFSIYASLTPEAMDAGDSFNDSNNCDNNGYYYNHSALSCRSAANSLTVIPGQSIPLNSLFAGDGFAFILVMIGLLIITLSIVLHKKK